MPIVFATVEREGKPAIDLVKVSLGEPAEVSGWLRWGGTFWSTDTSFMDLDHARIRLRLADGRTGEADVIRAEVRGAPAGLVYVRFDGRGSLG